MAQISENMTAPHISTEASDRNDGWRLGYPLNRPVFWLLYLLFWAVLAVLFYRYSLLFVGLDQRPLWLVSVGRQVIGSVLMIAAFQISERRAHGMTLARRGWRLMKIMTAAVLVDAVALEGMHLLAEARQMGWPRAMHLPALVIHWLAFMVWSLLLLLIRHARALQHELERNQAATVELQAQAEAAKTANSEYQVMQRQFVAMVSHEFRTPLTAISGSMFLLKKQCEGLPDGRRADATRYFGYHERAVATLTNLVDQVLLLNRLEHSEGTLATESVEVVGFVTELIGGMNAVMETPRIVLEAGAMPAGWQGMIDRWQVKAVIQNLVSNGLKYSEQDVTVRLALEGPEGWQLEVQDRGRGIPQEEQAGLFKPFYRAKNVGGVSGTGLGLTLVRRAVESHGGSITLHSVLGEGTTFTVKFPRMAGQRPDARPERERMLLPGQLKAGVSRVQ